MEAGPVFSAIAAGNLWAVGSLPETTVGWTGTSDEDRLTLLDKTPGPVVLRSTAGGMRVVDRDGRMFQRSPAIEHLVRILENRITFTAQSTGSIPGLPFWITLEPAPKAMCEQYCIYIPYSLTSDKQPNVIAHILRLNSSIANLPKPQLPFTSDAPAVPRKTRASLEELTTSLSLFSGLTMPVEMPTDDGWIPAVIQLLDRTYDYDGKPAFQARLMSYIKIADGRKELPLRRRIDWMQRGTAYSVEERIGRILTKSS